METYDPKKVSVVANGKHIVGFMDGKFVECDKNADNVTAHIGAQGDVTFSENADNTGLIKVTLKQTSSSLAYLMDLSESKTAFPISVVDANTGSFRAGGTQCRIQKTPSRTFGAEVDGVEIDFYVADYKAN